MTQEAKHTPKGWFVDIGAEHTIIRGPGGDSICAMKRNTGDRFENEQDANAHVMAASVDLYETVKYLRQQLWQEWHSHMTEELFLKDATVIAIDTALAKAEGRS